MPLPHGNLEYTENKKTNWGNILDVTKWRNNAEKEHHNIVDLVFSLHILTVNVMWVKN